MKVVNRGKVREQSPNGVSDFEKDAYERLSKVAKELWTRPDGLVGVRMGLNDYIVHTDAAEFFRKFEGHIQEVEDAIEVEADFIKILEVEQAEKRSKNVKHKEGAR